MKEYKNIHLGFTPGCTLGTDIEMFIIDKKNKLVNPKELIKKINLTRVHQDGLALEFASHIHGCREELEADVYDLFRRVTRSAKELDLTISRKSFMELSQKEFDELPNDIKILGCAPDINVYTGRRNQKGQHANVPRRTCGGHLHFGFGDEIVPYYIKQLFNTRTQPETSEIYKAIKNKVWFDINSYDQRNNTIKIKKNIFNRLPKVYQKNDTISTNHMSATLLWGLINQERIIKMFDAYIGLVSVLLDNDTQKNRRKIYGKAGDYREKPYGLEYRTLSNFYLFDRQSIFLLFGLGIKGLYYIHDDRVMSVIEELSIAIQNAINYGDKELAQDLLKEITKQKAWTLYSPYKVKDILRFIDNRNKFPMVGYERYMGKLGKGDYN